MKQSNEMRLAIERRRPLTPAAPKSTCQTSLGRWWKPTHVGGHDGTRSLLWVNRQLSCETITEGSVPTAYTSRRKVCKRQSTLLTQAGIAVRASANHSWAVAVQCFLCIEPDREETSPAARNPPCCSQVAEDLTA